MGDLLLPARRGGCTAKPMASLSGKRRGIATSASAHVVLAAVALCLLMAGACLVTQDAPYVPEESGVDNIFEDVSLQQQPAFRESQIYARSARSQNSENFQAADHALEGNQLSSDMQSLLPKNREFMGEESMSPETQMVDLKALQAQVKIRRAALLMQGATAKTPFKKGSLGKSEWRGPPTLRASVTQAPYKLEDDERDEIEEDDELDELYDA